MKSIAFAPGHISGFFEPVYNPQDISRSGSRGAGINISLGAISEVSIINSSIQNFQIFINNKKSQAPVTELALKYLIGKNPLNIIVKTQLNLPIGQGFGMSGAGALSATLAAAKIVGLSNNDALKAAHYAEVQLRTGLGDVMASSFGGMEIRKTPGLPPWGIIEHIPCKSDIVLCVIGKKINTKKILSDNSKIKNVIEYGKYCTKKLLENPSVENFFFLSRLFTEKTDIADKKILEAIKSANNHGMASMSMIGNSVFAIGKTKELIKVLSPFGKTTVCDIDDIGARILQK
jgi:pantoate kinase